MATTRTDSRQRSGRGKLLAGTLILAFFAVVTLAASQLAPYPKNDIDFESWLAPSGAHLLGTDSYGQDVFSQLVYGTRTSFLVGILAGLITTVIGVLVGVTAGFYRRWVSDALMFLVDLLLIIPIMALMIILASYLPSMGLTSTILVIGLLSWLYMARSIRSQTLSERQRGYVEAARVAGMSNVSVMLREILPNLYPIILANLVSVTTQAVLAEAGLSFLGIGDPKNVSWGTILALAHANNAIMYDAWWWIVPPGLATALFCFGFILIGNGSLERYRYKRGAAQQL
ncbi:peptide/nickel transport system permease protein [Cohnella sp. OV330]|uniref:ABC transporter permease n=1 Tax=Cohnella sp. OV330 TaxID=1855288 RepID=UPI0008EFAB1F|nr:ABC transporter permease [Cohnella sp. OV330]SFB58440.1 peptide/nickel transport system permease protein [Cohnella sp. OV330]